MHGAYSIGNALQEATDRKFFIIPVPVFPNMEPDADIVACGPTPESEPVGIENRV